MDIVQILIPIVALVAVTVLFALRLARHSTRAYDGPELTPYDLAMLAGGPPRVADTAMAALTEGKAARARRDGWLTRVRSEPTGSLHPVAQETLALIGARSGGMPVWELRREAAGTPAMAALAARLRDLGLIDPPGSGRADPTHPNRTGQAALAHYRLRHREEKSLPARPRDHVAVDALNLFGIALYGLHQLGDEELRAVLCAEEPRPAGARPAARLRRRGSRRSRSSSAASGSSSGCGSSGSDGGPGGCGGGCGGGS
ncbi:putative membrane protein YgcG [Streptosporangium becharense]|uniref:Putative membrane protein YgcG n=1 Tax=Streptosporangium becharense TaxID=1816182 RepID=A0A7W9IJ69_9ACTN|nr:TIGR04222 domain-containing membrane protein [Streptosporangium becharense]MBB2913418.1 putative membrane protein YgcG [Streptosporangium becharense]MBB5821108.1 putative membrane protein YgcG [Streptosporangium becharense]